MTLLFLHASQTFNLPPKLLDSVCFIETKHDVFAVHQDDGGSKSLGVCQVKYKTARWLGFQGTEGELMEPGLNIYYAAKYLSYQQRRYKNIQRAVVAYNRGNAKNLQTTAYSVKVINQWKVASSERRTAGI